MPFIPNVTAQFNDDPEEIRALLSMQIYRSVLWEDTIQRLIEFGCDKFVEVGPGKVLKGLVRRIDKKVAVVCAGEPEGVEEGAGLCTGK